MGKTHVQTAVHPLLASQSLLVLQACDGQPGACTVSPALPSARPAPLGLAWGSALICIACTASLACLRVGDDAQPLLRHHAQLSTLLLSGDVEGPLCPGARAGRMAEEEDMMLGVMKKMGRPYKQSTLDRLMVGVVTSRARRPA